LRELSGVVRDKQIEVDQAQADLEQASGRFRPEGRPAAAALCFPTGSTAFVLRCLGRFGFTRFAGGSQAKSKGEAEPDELMDLQDTVYPAAEFAACHIRE
jgi:hypothetical protein